MHFQLCIPLEMVSVNVTHHSNPKAYPCDSVLSKVRATGRPVGPVEIPSAPEFPKRAPATLNSSHCSSSGMSSFCNWLSRPSFDSAPPLVPESPSITSPEAKARSIAELTPDAAPVDLIKGSRLLTVVDLAWPSRDEAEEVTVGVELALAARLLVPLTLELAVPVVERVAVAPSRELLVVATRDAAPLEVVRVRDVVEPVVRWIVDAAREVVPTLDVALLDRLDTRDAADVAPGDVLPVEELLVILETLDAAEPVEASTVIPLFELSATRATLEFAPASDERASVASLKPAEEAATRATLEAAVVPRVGVMDLASEATRLGAPDVA